MGAWIDRYTRGHHIAVWTDMLGMGSGLRKEPDAWAEAQAVASLTMRRARSNVDLLLARLTQEGYEFAPGEGMVVHEPPSPDVRDRLDELEAVIGPLPLALRAWCQEVGRVNLLGRHPGRSAECADALAVDVPLDHLHAEFQVWQGDRGTEWSDGRGFTVDIAPDRLHKAGISGGPPYGMAVPNDGADGLLLWEPHQTTFTGYLRLAFGAGGFPGLDHAGHGHPPIGPAAAPGWTAGLLPI